MSNENREKALRAALVFVGLICIFGLYAMMQLMTPSWTWEPRQAEYEQMIIGVYATLGVFLLIASRNPSKHRSLIWFAIWSSAVHGAIMAVQALRDPTEMSNFYGDIPTLFIAAILLAVLMPRKRAA